MVPTPHKGTVINRSANVFLARVEQDGVDILQADVTGITFEVFDTTDDDTSTLTGTPVVANTIFDTLQTDAMWTADTVGYNFKYEMPVAAFVTGKTYRVQFLIDPAAGLDFYLLYDVCGIDVLV